MRIFHFILLGLFVSQLAFGHSTGLKLPANWQRLAPWVSEFEVDLLPEEWDYREQGIELPIRNQGSCGSCWAFAITGAFEFAIEITLGKKVDLSEQELVSCSKSSSGCGGGFFDHDYQVNPGQSYERDYPYTASNGRCKSGVQRDFKLSHWFYIGKKNSKPSVDQIRKAIVEYGPVAVTVTANGAMQGYKGGKFKGCTNGGTNHMVILVGWKKDGTWIMRNSWGTKWGDGGYMSIPFGCSRIGEVATAVKYNPTIEEILGLE